MRKTSLLIWASIIWLVFVVSLAAWWMIFSLRTITRLSQFESSDAIIAQHQMLVMEGSVLIFLLIAGGTALVVYAIREKHHLDQIRLFFATFTHDMKTSISRLLLQSEEFAEGTGERFQDFQKNMFALEFQLENSLQMAQYSGRAVVREPVDMRLLISRLHHYWPSMKLTLSGKAKIISDAVAIESILRNVVSNAMIHGLADEIRIQIEEKNSKTVITITDNGTPTSFDFQKKVVFGSSSQKGSGIGLFLIHQWVKKLEGIIEFIPVDSGSIQVVLTLPAKKEVV